MTETTLHPRPRLTRTRWVDLNGPGGFAHDDADRGLEERWYEHPERFDRQIQVPFPPESELSGINDKGFHPVVWYRREFSALPVEGERLLLHFGEPVAGAMLQIGERVAIGPRCMLFCHSNAIPADVTATAFVDCHTDADIRIGNNVFIGAGVIVLPGAVIGDNVVVAAGSVVKGELAPGWLYAGQPARKVKALC